MRNLILISLISLTILSAPAFAATRTVQVTNSTGFVQAIIMGPVTTPAPSGVTFIVLTNDAIAVQSGWTYNFTTRTFSPPS